MEAVFKPRSRLDQGCLPEVHKDFGGQLFDLVLVVAGRDLLQLSVRQWYLQTNGEWGDIVALALNTVAPRRGVEEDPLLVHLVVVLLELMWIAKNTILIYIYIYNKSHP